MPLHYISLHLLFHYVTHPFVVRYTDVDISLLLPIVDLIIVTRPLIHDSFDLLVVEDSIRYL